MGDMSFTVICDSLSYAAFGEHDGCDKERHPGGRTAATKGQWGETNGRGNPVYLFIRFIPF